MANPTVGESLPTDLRRRSRIAHDADDHAHNLSQWDQCYDQFSPGHFQGQVTELWLPGLQVFLESANQALHQSCAAWEGAVWFGFPVPNQRPSRIDARIVPNHTVLFRPGNHEFELHTPEHAGIFGVVVSQNLLSECLIDMDELYRETSGGTGTLSVPREQYQQFIQTLGQLLLQPQSASFPSSREQIGALPGLILDQLCATLDAGARPTTQPQATRLRSSRKLVEDARNLVLSQPDQRISIADLCRQLHVSRRTLQNGFRATVGLAPLTYLRTLKLNQVRRCLHSLRERDTRVTRVATNWGFEHLGQFSRDYRLLFGEVPSATLRNAGD